MTNGTKKKIAELFEGERLLSDISAQFPILPDSEYRNFDLYSRMSGQSYSVGEPIFLTEFQVFLVDGEKIVGTASYTHIESAELLFEQALGRESNAILFDTKNIYNMSDWFTGISSFVISTRSSQYKQTENYIMTPFILKS